jgi:hypothetical protein
MKKLILMLLVFLSVLSARAQNSINNASNNGTPVSISTPQVIRGGVGLNAVNGPSISVTTPPVVTLNSVNAPGALPSVPAAPISPRAPPFGTRAPASSFRTTLNLPFVPTLPPIPPLPPLPDIRVPIGARSPRN